MGSGVFGFGVALKAIGMKVMKETIERMEQSSLEEECLNV